MQGFKLTYKELKATSAAYGLPYHGGFKLTYKELKAGYWFGSYNEIPVLS